VAPIDPPVATTRRVITEIVVAVVVLALAAGAVWSLVAPDVHGQVTTSGVTVRGAEARRQFGVDGWFAVTGAVAGLLVATAAFIRHRQRPVTVLVTLVLAGLAGSVLAWRFGVLLGPGPVADRTAGLAPGTRIAIPLGLRAPAVLLAWPIASAAAVAVGAAAISDHGRWRLSRPGRSWRSWRR
jgi:hypothetical protein